MARFLGSVSGQRGEALRLGSVSSGLTVKANGWDSGVKVIAEANSNGDTFHIVATGGSNKASHEQYLGSVSLRDGTLTFEPYTK